MGVTVVEYTCGHSTRNTYPDRENTVYQSADCCIDCFKSKNRLLQEGESLSTFVTRHTDTTTEAKPESRKRWAF